MAYDSGKLTLVRQAIAGPKKYVYTDTGGETAAVYAGAQYFSNAADMGVDTGDQIDVINVASELVYSGFFISDTGSQGGAVRTITLDTGSSG